MTSHFEEYPQDLISSVKGAFIGKTLGNDSGNSPDAFLRLKSDWRQYTIYMPDSEFKPRGWIAGVGVTAQYSSQAYDFIEIDVKMVRSWDLPHPESLADLANLSMVEKPLQTSIVADTGIYRLEFKIDPPFDKISAVEYKGDCPVNVTEGTKVFDGIHTILADLRKV